MMVNILIPLASKIFTQESPNHYLWFQNIATRISNRLIEAFFLHISSKFEVILQAKEWMVPSLLFDLLLASADNISKLGLKNVIWNQKTQMIEKGYCINFDSS